MQTFIADESEIEKNNRRAIWKFGKGKKQTGWKLVYKHESQHAGKAGVVTLGDKKIDIEVQ